jgi:hypothetical protein
MARSRCASRTGSCSNLDDVTFRLMREEDLPMLQAWIGRAHVRQWWAGEETDFSPGPAVTVQCCQTSS